MSIPRKLACGLAAGCAVAAAVSSLALASTASSTATALPQLNVTLTGKSVALSGQVLSGGVEVVAHTTGERSGQLIFVRLNPGVSYAQARAFGMSQASQDLQAIRQIGSIVFDATAPKGTTHVQVALQPGNYVALDVAQQSGPSPSSPFMIGQSAHPAALPKPAATVRAIEFGFRGAATLHSGSLVRWANDGYLVHMLDVIRTTSQYPAARIVRLLRDGKVRQIPRSLNTTAGAGPVSWQAYQQQRLNLSPGTYVLACFMNTQDGRDHVVLGMERIVKVVH